MLSKGAKMSLNHSKPKGVTDECYTPKHIFDSLGLSFDLDVCAPNHGAFVPAKQRYSLPFDGLAAPWFGLVWMNPPYSKPAPWVDKFIQHNNGVTLLPVTNGKWFDQIWNAAQGVLTLRSLQFTRPDGSAKGIFFRTALFAFGDVSYQALINSNLGKVR